MVPLPVPSIHVLYLHNSTTYLTNTLLNNFRKQFSDFVRFSVGFRTGFRKYRRWLELQNGAGIWSTKLFSPLLNYFPLLSIISPSSVLFLPPLYYLNDDSWQFFRVIVAMNALRFGGKVNRKLL